MRSGAGIFRRAFADHVVKRWYELPDLLDELKRCKVGWDSNYGAAEAKHSHVPKYQKARSSAV